MKTFSFSLDKVLAWKRTQQRLEEMKQERIHGELRSIDARRAALAEEKTAAERLSAAGGITGPELAALDRFRKHLGAEQARLANMRQGAEKRLSEQMNVVMVKRRDVMLLEKVRQHRLDEWNRQAAREMDLQAEESALYKWMRVQ